MKKIALVFIFLATIYPPATSLAASATAQAQAGGAQAGSSANINDTDVSSDATSAADEVVIYQSETTTNVADESSTDGASDLSTQSDVTDFTTLSKNELDEIRDSQNKLVEKLQDQKNQLDQVETQQVKILNLFVVLFAIMLAILMIQIYLILLWMKTKKDKTVTFYPPVALGDKLHETEELEELNKL